MLNSHPRLCLLIVSCSCLLSNQGVHLNAINVSWYLWMWGDRFDVSIWRLNNWQKVRPRNARDFLHNHHKKTWLKHHISNRPAPVPGRLIFCVFSLCRWNVVGIQGSLMSYFTEPIYFSSIILGSLYHADHLSRAMYQRIADIEDLPQQFTLNRPLLSGQCLLWCGADGYRFLLKDAEILS